MRTCAALVTLLLICGAAEAVPTTWYLPGAAEAEGANQSRFSSTLFITNPGDAPATLSLNFIPYAGGRAPRDPVARVVTAGETLRIGRLLETVFGFTADAGTVTVTSESLVLMYMVTSNIANPAGTYGLAIPPVRSSELLTGGAQIGNVIWVNHNGEDFGRGYRTNVGGVLVDPNSEVEIRVLDENSNLRSSRRVGSAKPASFQLSLTDIIGPLNLPIGRVEFIVRQGRAAGYVSVVDNLTSDGIALLPKEASHVAADLLINGVARTGGVNNTHWETDVRLFNPAFIPITVSFTGIGFRGTSSIMREVPARGTVEMIDILGPNGLNVGDGSAGAVRIVSKNAADAVARTTNSDPTGAVPGTFSGLQEPVLFTSGYLRPGPRYSLIGTEESANVRTNVGFLAGSDGAIVNLTLRGRTGNTVATRRLELESREWVQFAIVSLFKNVTIPQVGRIDISLESGLVDMYASKIDNGTGDPVVITPLMLP